MFQVFWWEVISQFYFHHILCLNFMSSTNWRLRTAQRSLTWLESVQRKNREKIVLKWKAEMKMFDNTKYSPILSLTTNGVSELEYQYIIIVSLFLFAGISCITFLCSILPADAQIFVLFHSCFACLIFHFTNRKCILMFVLLSVSRYQIYIALLDHHLRTIFIKLLIFLM